MARNSARDRAALYFPAPSLSGPASYGGVPKELYSRVMTISAASFVATMVVMLLALALTGTFFLRALMVPVFITVIASLTMLVMTKKRRDILSILRESRQFEKDEKR